MQIDISLKQFAALKLYNLGYTRKQASEILNISEHTFAWYLKKIRQKFCVRTRKEMLELEHQLNSTLKIYDQYCDGEQDK